jgi:hypothetical protein
MPNYNFRHKENGDVQKVFLRISELDEWKEANPEWEYYIPMGSTFSISSNGTGDMLAKVPDGFKDRLNSIKKGAGENNSIKIV